MDRKTELIEAHLFFTRKLAREQASRLPIAFDDALSSAHLGLVEAAGRWAAKYPVPNKDEKAFPAYLALRVKGAILDFVRKEDVLTKCQRSILTRSKQLPDDLTAPQIADVLDVPLRDVVRAKAHEQTRLRYDLDEVIGELYDADTSTEIQMLFVSALKELSPIQQEVLLLRYHYGMPKKEIVSRCGMTHTVLNNILRTSTVHVYLFMRKAFTDGDD